MTYMRSWKSHRLTSHTRLGLNPQIGRPLSRIVVPLVYFFIKFCLLSFFFRYSALSYTISMANGSCADRFIPSGCGFLQYGLVQPTCTSLNVFFSSMGLTISASKSEVMLFTRKHKRPPILLRIGSYVLPHTTYFNYLGIFFDAGSRWSCHVKYVPPKGELVEIGDMCLGERIYLV
jgi:hypothetical protein